METWQVLLKNADSEIESLKDERNELRARVAELEQRIAAALAVDAPADVKALAMRAALKGGE